MQSPLDLQQMLGTHGLLTKDGMLYQVQIFPRAFTLIPGAIRLHNKMQGVSAPNAVGGEAGVELERPLLPERLHGAVDRAVVGVLAVRTLLHLLDARLHEVEGQTAAGTAVISVAGLWYQRAHKSKWPFTNPQHVGLTNSVCSRM